MLNSATNATGTHNGFYYSFWKDTGNVQITCGADGNYGSSWSNINNWVGGKGWNPGSASKVVSYTGQFNQGNNLNQNTYLALYGWTRNP